MKFVLYIIDLHLILIINLLVFDVTRLILIIV
jgi:hypothetical protein